MRRNGQLGVGARKNVKRSMSTRTKRTKHAVLTVLCTYIFDTLQLPDIIYTVPPRFLNLQKGFPFFLSFLSIDIYRYDLYFLHNPWLVAFLNSAVHLEAAVMPTRFFFPSSCFSPYVPHIFFF